MPVQIRLPALFSNVRFHDKIVDVGTKHGHGKKLNCVVCGNEFTAQGSRVTCGSNCRDIAKARRFPQVKQHKCRRIECDVIVPAGPVRKDRQYCSKKCFSLDRKPTSDTIGSHGKYLRISGPTVYNHPAFIGWYNAHQHVLIAYNKYGEGPHSCHWCGHEIEWMFGEWAGLDAEIRKINVDHLDDDGHNNDPDNLVLSCNSCNTKRSRG